MSKRSPDQTDSGRYIAITNYMQETADKLREAFVAVRESLIPGSGGVGKHNDQFLLGAQLCLQLKEDPVEFVTKQLKGALAQGAPLFVSLVHNRSLAMRVREPKKEKIEQVDSASRYKFQLELFKQRLNIFTPGELLRDPMQPFSPLFRYCMGVKLGLDDIVKHNKAEARTEYRADPLARDVFKQEVEGL